MNRSSILVVALVLGCNGNQAGAAGEEETGGEVDLCVSALDPATYTTPAWSPSPVTATPDCPALDGPVVLELASVMVTGVVQLQDSPLVPEMLELRGREGEGIVRLTVAEDGTFGAPILAGHYDVWVSTTPGAVVEGERLAFENLDFTSSAQLGIDVPPLHSVTATMTMDGELAPGPYAHIFVSELGESNYFDLVGRMDQGMHTIQLAPGEYEFNYSFCNPAVDPNTPDYGGPHCYDPELDLPADDESPRQWVAPIATAVVDQDLQIHLDVPTVRFSATVTIDGQPLDGHNEFVLRSDVGKARWYVEGPLDERVVVGTYDVYPHEDAPASIEDLVLEQDTHVDLALERHPFSVVLSEESPVVEAEDPFLSGRLILSAIGSEEWEEHGIAWWVDKLVFAGPHEIDTWIYYCWPDYPYPAPPFHRDLLLDIDGPTEIDLIPEFARVRIDYVNTTNETVRVDLRLAEDDGGVWVQADDGQLQVHGVVPAGMYRVRGDLVEIVDGMSIEWIEVAQMIEIDASVDGMAIAAEDHIWVGEMYDEGFLRTPGHYSLIYHHGEDDSLPQNTDAILGCVTVEG